jgi:hypothetical protein
MLQPVQRAVGPSGLRTTRGLQGGQLMPLRPLLARAGASRSQVKTATAAGAAAAV